MFRSLLCIWGIWKHFIWWDGGTGWDVVSTKLLTISVKKVTLNTWRLSVRPLLSSLYFPFWVGSTLVNNTPDCASQQLCQFALILPEHQLMFCPQEGKNIICPLGDVSSVVVSAKVPSDVKVLVSS